MILRVTRGWIVVGRTIEIGDHSVDVGSLVLTIWRLD